LKKHAASACHREAVEVVITLPATTEDVGELISASHQRDKQQNSTVLMKLLCSIRFLTRQGMALRGDGSEEDGNYLQLLQLLSSQDPLVAGWLQKKRYRYTSHKIQDDFLDLMGKDILRNISSRLQQSKFATLMIDETTDVSNSSQAVVVLRYVTDAFDVCEDLIGLYKVPSTDAVTLVATAKEALKDADLPISKLRGQCYDGAAAMRGIRSGVAKRILDEEPRAVYTHCYGHSINLAMNDSIKSSKPVKNSLEVTHEITKLIKYSPRREGIFEDLKDKHDISVGYHTPGVRVLCPTRWTVCANALASVISNYDVLLNTWDEALEVVSDTASKARINGVASQMKKFDFVFGAILGEMILRHSDNLSQCLQKKTISAAEGQHVAKMVIDTLQSIRTDESFDLFWQKVAHFCEDNEVQEAQMPRRRKLPARFDDGLSSGHFSSSPKDHYRQLYFEGIDTAIGCLVNRFDQEGYKVYRNLEDLLIKASCKDNFDQQFLFVCDFYKDDIIPDDLRSQLVIFGNSFQSIPAKEKPTSPTIFDIKDYFANLSTAQKGLLGQVGLLLKLILVMPATNATSERSFSALRRVKTYLRSTMTQNRLNNLLLLHVHKDYTDSLDLKSIINRFIADCPVRRTMFATM